MPVIAVLISAQTNLATNQFSSYSRGNTGNNSTRSPLSSIPYDGILRHTCPDHHLMSFICNFLPYQSMT